MREMIKMVLVLTFLSLVSGAGLAYIRDLTAEDIEVQELKFVKGPAILSILDGASNKPIEDRFPMLDGEKERKFFVGIFDGKAETVAFETIGKGFGGKIGVMVGVNTTDDKIVGVQVTTHTETPGVGARAKDEPEFSAQFKGLSLTPAFKIKADGGQVDAISGATVTSRGVSAALTEAADSYGRLKPQVVEKLKEFSK